jgi:drug/metabolite transporter (DMT)-like permease
MAPLFGFLGVLGFSFTLPATRAAVEDLDAGFVGLGRAVVAGLLAGGLLLLLRQPLPERRQLLRLALVAAGVVVGFPLLTALALRELTAAHSAVIVGLTPAATAVAAVALAGERPSRSFWGASLAGLVAVLAFAASQGAGLPGAADLLVIAAVASVAIGYAQGGALARELGGWQVICWALVIAFPLLAPVTAIAAVGGGLGDADADAWLGFAYVSLISMFLAFFAWYRGLALGGVAKIGQVQLVQPLLTLLWSALLLSEEIGALTVLAALAVLASVAATQRTRVSVPDQQRDQQQHQEVDALVDHHAHGGVGLRVGVLDRQHVAAQQAPVVLDQMRDRDKRGGADS